MSSKNLSIDSHDSYCRLLQEQRKMAKDPSMAYVLINDIMKKYFCEKADQGSSCSLFSDQNKSVYSADKRLDYWAQILEDRKRIACRIRKVTGKRISHVLYNQIEDYRNVQNIKKVLNIAEEIDRIKEPTKQVNYSKRSGLYETLPRYQRLRKPDLEIVEMPRVTRNEQWIKDIDNGYLASKVLHKKIGEKNFSNVIEHYPETDGLQVVGKRIHKHLQRIKRDSDYKLSRTSSASYLEPIYFPEHSLQVNDQIINKDDNQWIKPIRFNLEFKCRPSETQKLTVCRIRNNGRKPILFLWKRKTPIGFAHMPSVKPSFFFNQQSFRLNYDETKTVEVHFKPTKENTFDEQWHLTTKPVFFKASKNIFLKLTGESLYPKDFFTNIIDSIIESIISSIFPGKIHKKAGPNDEELFEKYNPGLRFEPTFIARFKDLFQQFRKKLPSSWDLKLETLTLLIESCPDYLKREQGMDTFRRIIREMRLRRSFCNINVKNKIARSVIISFMDKWEQKAIVLVDAVSKTDIDNLLIRMPYMLEKIGKVSTLNKKRKIIQNEALYGQMYCCFCDLIDEIVLFIDNCALLEKSI